MVSGRTNHSSFSQFQILEAYGNKPIPFPATQANRAWTQFQLQSKPQPQFQTKQLPLNRQVSEPHSSLTPRHSSVVLLPVRGRTRSNSNYNLLPNLKCFYTNAGLLGNKWSYFNSQINYHNLPHIILVCESWFNESSIINLVNYNIFIKNRKTDFKEMRWWRFHICTE